MGAGLEIGMEAGTENGAAAGMESKAVIFGRKELYAKKIFGKVTVKPLDV